MKIPRIIPSVMFSQHPDHAGTPFWHHQPFIETHHEVEECYRMFNELGAEEVMGDWEGKLADESVVERLLGTYPGFFRKQPLGRDLFLTFRVPNPRLESGYRLARTYMVILWSQHLAREHGLASLPLFEVILPMVESGREILNIQKNFQRLAKAAAASFEHRPAAPQTIEVIPTFESVGTLLQSRELLRHYLRLYHKTFNAKPPYLRPFCARSDPALNSGIVATTLAIKRALSDYVKLSRETGIPCYPIIAPGALPFRGGLTPRTAEAFAAEFGGVRTVVIQSSFRYDYPQPEVKKAIVKLKHMIPHTKTAVMSRHTEHDVAEIMPWFEKPYRKTVEQTAHLITAISRSIPQRRERILHIGLFGYSRQLGKVKLPRAIGFTASCYSLGLPPELFGLGPGLIKTRREKKIPLLERWYQTFRPSLVRAGRYVRKESLQELGLDKLTRDIEAVEEYLGEPLGPRTKAEQEHAKLVKKIITAMKRGQHPEQEITEAALLRKSLG